MHGLFYYLVCVLVKADGSQLGVCSIDGTLLVWDYPSCDTLLKIQLSTFHLSIDWNPWRMNSFANHVSAEVSNNKM
jgi:hypothetical protein